MDNVDLSKMALMTDIHFGAKGNSELHNKDCLEYIDWFCDIVRNSNADSVGFLGDWYENRNALNIATMNYSYEGAKKLNDLGLPVYYIIGNHDLYHRHTREIHSVIQFHEFDNFKVIEHPTLIKNKKGDILFCPYMFHDEYPDLTKNLDVPVWMGHFEFRGFELTGAGSKMLTGPDPVDFIGPKRILSGHFHKRQVPEDCNIAYIGNTFPTTFGDANDFERGMCFYDFIEDTLDFIDWEDGPSYVKTSLSLILDGKFKFKPKSYVKCLIDIPINFDESKRLKHTFIEKYQLRDFIPEESHELNQALEETELEFKFELEDLASIDELVIQMLEQIETEHIENKLLVKIYDNLIKNKEVKK